jgi:hypothetical protein
VQKKKMDDIRARAVAAFRRPWSDTTYNNYVHQIIANQLKKDGVRGAKFHKELRYRTAATFRHVTTVLLKEETDAVISNALTDMSSDGTHRVSLGTDNRGQDSTDDSNEALPTEVSEQSVSEEIV